MRSGRGHHEVLARPGCSPPASPRAIRTPTWRRWAWLPRRLGRRSRGRPRCRPLAGGPGLGPARGHRGRRRLAGGGAPARGGGAARSGRADGRGRQHRRRRAADSTVLLALAQRLGIRRYLQTLYDPEAVGRCLAAGVGTTVTLAVGAKTDRSHGEPVEVTGRVRVLFDGRYEDPGRPTPGGASSTAGRRPCSRPPTSTRWSSSASGPATPASSRSIRPASGRRPAGRGGERRRVAAPGLLAHRGRDHARRHAGRHERRPVALPIPAAPPAALPVRAGRPVSDGESLRAGAAPLGERRQGGGEALGDGLEAERLRMELVLPPRL